MPMGWPTAMAPPLTLTISGFTPSSRVEPAHHPERLVDLYDVELVDRDSFATECFLIALAGCDWGVESGPATTPCAPISASHVSANCCAFSWFITTMGAVPLAHERSNPGDYVTGIFDLTTVDEAVKAVQEYPMSVGYRESK
jgi:hypothetical protein